MEFVIVTGLSGAGKSRAVGALEDIGYYCVDNIPPTLIPVIYDMCEKSEHLPSKVAVVTDTRGGELFKSFFDAVETLRSQNKNYKILFLDCSDAVLVNRYQETRRKHPLSDSVNGSLERAVRLERDVLMPVKEHADFIIDTTNLRPQYMKDRISKIFLDNTDGSLIIHCMSFGFKNGVPLESDLVFDVRCLPNPYYIDELRPKTGLDPAVYNYVMDKPEAAEFREKLTDMIDFLTPLYRKEGKSQLVIAIGCTGGHHRSVAFAQYLHEHLGKKGLRTTVSHRDIKK